MIMSGVDHISMSTCTQLDVFAFGMTIYELLSFKAPFENIEPVAKRNHLVKDGQRPSLKGKVSGPLGRKGHVRGR